VFAQVRAVPGRVCKIAGDSLPRFESWTCHQKPQVIAGLDRVRALRDGKAVADHARAWAWHQTISDPAHVAAARALRR